MSNIDLSGFDKKMDLAQNLVDSTLPKFIEDSGVYILARLVESVLNGQPGTSYPKSYPGGISEGSSGYVGIITSNLRRSMGLDRRSQFLIIVRQIFPALAPYHDDMIEWSKRRYSKDFYEITSLLYGPKVINEYSKLLQGFIQATNNLQRKQYRNPYPA